MLLFPALLVHEIPVAPMPAIKLATIFGGPMMFQTSVPYFIIARSMINNPQPTNLQPKATKHVLQPEQTELRHHDAALILMCKPQFGKRESTASMNARRKPQAVQKDPGATTKTVAP